MIFFLWTMILLLSSLVVSQSLILHRHSLWWKFAVVVEWIVVDLVWLFALCLLLVFLVSDATLQL